MHGDRSDVSGAPPLARRIGSGSRRHLLENTMATTGNLKSKKRKSTTKSVSRVTIFGPAPVLRGEDQKAYNQLFEEVSSSVKPADRIEDCWVGDIVYLTWEILRLRRYKRELIETSMSDGLVEVLGPSVECMRDGHPSSASTREIAELWVRQDRNILEYVDALLEERGHTMDTVWAHAFAFQLDDIERLERLIAAAEARRNRVLNEIDFRRDFTRRIRRAIKEVDEREPEIVNHKAITHQETGGEHDQCAEASGEQS
jgi:hypothetical protein